jgi:hypothetical protein
MGEAVLATAPKPESGEATAATAARVLNGVTIVLVALCAWVIGVLAWGENRWPALAVLVPLLWIVAPGRWSAFIVGLLYPLAAVRFVPDLAGRWLGASAFGIASWLGLGLFGGALFAALWPRTATPLRVVAATVALLVIWLPLGVVLPGHPVFGWGYILHAWHWFGVAAMFLVTCAIAIALRVGMPKRWPGMPWLNVAVLPPLAILLCFAAARPDPAAGKVVGAVGAINTAWGEFPRPNSLEVIQRIEKIGQATQSLAGGEGAIDTAVFPEAVLGLYDPSLFPVIEGEILKRTRRTGQTVVIGADVRAGPHTYQNAAIILRPDGSSTWLAARQSTPVGQWHPWSPADHFPSDWLASSVVTLGGGVRARVMFCHEEYVGLLPLLSEAREEQNMVVVLSNLWAAGDGLANAVQAAHTEGIARLFGRPWIRAVNGQRKVALPPSN